MSNLQSLSLCFTGIYNHLNFSTHHAGLAGGRFWNTGGVTTGSHSRERRVSFSLVSLKIYFSFSILKHLKLTCKLRNNLVLVYKMHTSFIYENSRFLTGFFSSHLLTYSPPLQWTAFPAEVSNILLSGSV